MSRWVVWAAAGFWAGFWSSAAGLVPGDGDELPPPCVYSQREMDALCAAGAIGFGGIGRSWHCVDSVAVEDPR